MILFTSSFASLGDIDAFEADFTQSITDDKNKVLTYSGHVIAAKPMYAKWKYTKPVEKDVYINSYNITIVEPEIEQVIVKRLKSKFDFFSIIKNAKEIKKDVYETYYKESKFTITAKNSLIKSISYVDEFDNKVKIIFTKQIQNKKRDINIFTPKFPLEFDIVRD
jgi:outer membrane lipoprotein carrier protein